MEILQHRKIHVGTPGTTNTWAPEIYWDAAKSKWLVIWSSTVAGRHEGNRIFSSLTADFKTFSPPEIFFDPGYVVIDATILQTRGKYYLVFKDERLEPLHKWIRIAEGASLEGPWKNISGEITESWSEGPSAIQVGNDYMVYYDHYRGPKRYQAVRSSDLQHWTSVTTEMQLPESAKHGSFLRITEDEKARIEAAHGSPWAAASQTLPDLYHDEKPRRSAISYRGGMAASAERPRSLRMARGCQRGQRVVHFAGRHVEARLLAYAPHC